MTDSLAMIATQPKPVPVTGRDADGWLTPGRFAAVLGVFLGVTFPGVLAGQETFFQRDFGVFTYPVAQYFRECFWRGELPLWNPFNECGVPLLAQWNTAILYPPSLFYLVFPLSWSLGAFNVAHLFWAGLGMYFLARRWTGNALAASVAGMVFGFNGLSWHMLIWISNLAAWAWMPWVVLTVEQAWSKGGWRRIGLASVAGAMQMLSGAPEIIFLTWAFLGAMCLGQSMVGTIERGRMLGRFVGVTLLVAGLSAAQLLPFLELLAHSNRDPNFSGGSWAMPLSGLGNFLVPLFHCFSGVYGVFVQHDQYWTSSYYLGAGVTALALAAVFWVRDRRVWLLAVAALVALLLALGPDGFIYSAIKAVVPQLGFMRYPIKFVVMVVFVVPLLAAYAVKWCQAGESDGERKRTAILSVAAVLLGLVGLIGWLAWKYPLAGDNWPATWHNALLRAAFLVLVPATLLALQRVAASNLQNVLQLTLLALLWLDVYTHAPNLNPTVARGVYEPGAMRKKLNLEPEPQLGDSRVMESLAAINTIHSTALGKPSDDYLCRRLAFYDNCNLLDDVPKLDGFFSLYLRESDRVLAQLYGADAHGIDLKGLKDFLGVSQISAPDTAPGRILDWTARDTFLPLVTAGQKPSFAPDTNAWLAVTAKDFDPRELVYLPPQTKPMIKAVKKTDAKVSDAKYSAHRIEFEVETTEPAIVVVAQAFYQPWHAYLDGEAVALLRANYAFQAVEVPVGRHAVMVVYQDRLFEIGLAISVGTLLLIGARWLREKREKSPNS
jgi:hypothetical protein